MTKITVVDVNVTKAGNPGKKPYEVAEVVYQGDRGVATKKLVSFSNPQVFSLFKDARKGDEFDITLVKEGDYWQWSSANRASGGTTAPAGAASAPATRTSNYETPDERAARQVLIVKQNALTNAVAFSEENATVEDVLNTAQVFSNWVLDIKPIEKQLDDIPF